MTLRRGWLGSCEHVTAQGGGHLVSGSSAVICQGAQVPQQVHHIANLLDAVSGYETTRELFTVAAIAGRYTSIGSYATTPELLQRRAADRQRARGEAGGTMEMTRLKRMAHVK